MRSPFRCETASANFHRISRCCPPPTSPPQPTHNACLYQKWHTRDTHCSTCRICSEVVHVSANLERCAYMYVRVYTYAHVRAQTHTHMHTQMYTHTHIRTYTHTRTHTYTHIDGRYSQCVLCTCPCTHGTLGVFVYTDVHLHIHARTHTHTHIHAHAHTDR